MRFTFVNAAFVAGVASMPFAPPHDPNCEVTYVTGGPAPSASELPWHHPYPPHPLHWSSAPYAVPSSSSSGVYSSGVYSTGVYSTGVYSTGVYSTGVYSTGVYSSQAFSSAFPSSSAPASSSFGAVSYSSAVYSSAPEFSSSAIVSSSAPASSVVGPISSSAGVYSSVLASSSVVVSSAPASSSAVPSRSAIPSSSAAVSSAGWGSSAPVTGTTKWPYPSGTIVVSGTDPWTITYSAPTQMTWAPSSSADFVESEKATSYVLTSTDTASMTHVTTTTTTEAACTAAPDSYQKSVVDTHNEMRANHTANPVVWDDKLACIAQRQAKSCIWEHLTYVDGGGYGQNLAGGSGESIEEGIVSWYSEAPNFDGYYGEQNPGGDFGSYGHFTQLVWAYTTSVGCATFDCGDGNGDANSATGNLNVCNYYAGGNMADMYGVYVLPAKGS